MKTAKSRTQMLHHQFLLLEVLAGESIKQLINSSNLDVKNYENQTLRAMHRITESWTYIAHQL